MEAKPKSDTFLAKSCGRPPPPKSTTFLTPPLKEEIYEKLYDIKELGIGDLISQT